VASVQPSTSAISVKGRVSASRRTNATRCGALSCSSTTIGGHPHVPVPDDGGQRVGGVPGAQEGLGQPGADVVFAPRCGRPQPVQADPPGDGGEPGPLVTQGRAGVVVERGRVNTCSAGVMTYAAGAGSGSPGHPPSTRVIASRSGGVTHSPYVAFTATCRATYLHQ